MPLKEIKPNILMANRASRGASESRPYTLQSLVWHQTSGRAHRPSHNTHWHNNVWLPFHAASRFNIQHLIPLQNTKCIEKKSFLCMCIIFKSQEVNYTAGKSNQINLLRRVNQEELSELFLAGLLENRERQKQMWHSEKTFRCHRIKKIIVIIIQSEC